MNLMDFTIFNKQFKYSSFLSFFKKKDDLLFKLLYILKKIHVAHGKNTSTIKCIMVSIKRTIYNNAIVRMSKTTQNVRRYKQDNKPNEKMWFRKRI